MKKFLFLISVSIVMIQNCHLAFSQDDNKQEKGPTIFLCCYETNEKTNPLADFMYFVPLISPVQVTNEQSANNQQIGYVISCTKETKKSSFHTVCEFRMEGQGSNLNDFDKEGMIERNKKNIKKGKPLNLMAKDMVKSISLAI